MFCLLRLRMFDLGRKIEQIRQKRLVYYKSQIIFKAYDVSIKTVFVDYIKSK